MNADVQARCEEGDLVTAMVRAMIFISLGRLVKGADERGFAILRQVRASRPESRRMSLAQFKELVRDQYLIVRHDEERAIATIAKLLPDDAAERAAALDVVRRIVAVGGEPSAEVLRRLSQIEALFERAPAVETKAEWKVAEAPGTASAARGSETKPIPERRAAKARS
jgi:hypothetical protein